MTEPLQQRSAVTCYDIFIAKFDGWVALGLIAQACFYHALPGAVDRSERARRSVVPLAFWFFSIGGGLLSLIYGSIKPRSGFHRGQLALEHRGLCPQSDLIFIAMHAEQTSAGT